MHFICLKLEKVIKVGNIQFHVIAGEETTSSTPVLYSTQHVIAGGEIMSSTLLVYSAQVFEAFVVFYTFVLLLRFSFPLFEPITLLAVKLYTNMDIFTMVLETWILTFRFCFIFHPPYLSYSGKS